MKPGLNIGQKSEVEIVVSAEMCPRFGEHVVHNLLSTSSLVHNMEWAARKTILPYLAEDEEGVGTQVSVSHLKPSLIGMKVRIEAVVSEIKDNRVLCDIEAFNSRGLIARGSVAQVIVAKTWLKNKTSEIALLDSFSRVPQVESTAVRGEI